MDEKSIKLFLGFNGKYYQRKWSTVQLTGRANTWNWSAFLFSVLWLSFRKMYGLSLIFSFCIILSSFIAITFRFSLEGFVLIILIWPVMLGYFGNRMYYYYMENRFLEIYGSGLNEKDMRVLIKSEGGINFPSVVFVIIIFSLIYYFMFAWLNMLPAAFTPINLYYLLIS